MMGRVIVRPTVAADLPHVIAIPLPHRIRAVTAELDGRVLGVGGLGYKPDGTIVGFAVLTDELRRYPVAVHRAGLAGMAMVRSAGVARVIAEAQEDNPAAASWLERLGFRREVVATADGDQEAFVWERGSDVE